MAVKHDPARLLDQIENLSRTHREHELYYSQAPLDDAVTLQRISRTLKALAGQWQPATPLQVDGANRYAGCDDLNVQAAIEQLGVLLLEGEGEPGEITRITRELTTQAADHEQTGAWLGEAMRSTWATEARALLEIGPLADLLGERHRIIAAKWQNAELNTIIAALLTRANEILDRIDFTPAALRADLAERRLGPRYLYSAAELIDHAADLLAEGAVLVHESERRWRVFAERVKALRGRKRSNRGVDRLMSTFAHKTRRPSRRPLLGLRRQPGRLALAAMRLPRPLYDHGWGRLLGHIFLLIVHQGRKSGKRRETVAMALTWNPTTQEVVVCSAWGETEWLRNLRAHPALEIRIAGESFMPEQYFLSEDESVAVAIEFRTHHPWRLRLFSTILDWGDLTTEDAVRELVRGRPFVSFRPAGKEHRR